MKKFSAITLKALLKLYFIDGITAWVMYDEVALGIGDLKVTKVHSTLITVMVRVKHCINTLSHTLSNNNM